MDLSIQNISKRLIFHSYVNVYQAGYDLFFLPIHIPWDPVGLTFGDVSPYKPWPISFGERWPTMWAPPVMAMLVELTPMNTISYCI